MINEDWLLFMEPKNKPRANPLIDECTRKMAAALRSAKKGIATRDGFRTGAGYRGVHVCVCGAMSSNVDLYLEGDEWITNSLAVHYLAMHRDEVSVEQLSRILELSCGEVEPTEEEILGKVMK